MQALPRWVENLIVNLLKKNVDPDVIKMAFVQWKEQFLGELRALAAETSNTIDDKVVAAVEQALSTCTPDNQFLCDVIAKGKATIVGKLRELAQKTDTILDDAAVDILEAAMQ